MYSTLKVSVACHSCDWVGDVEVQFKYGNLYAHRYGLGSRLIWGETQIGEPSERRVAVHGIIGCPSCDVDLLFDILIEDGLILSIGLQRGEYDYHHGEGLYVILDKSDKIA